MPQLFPKWSNNVPKALLLGLTMKVVLIIFVVWYFFSPTFLEVGYAPEQPVPYSHKFHVGELGIDCQYCHVSAFESAHVNIPATQTCMNCHGQIKTDSEKLAPIRESWDTGKPVEWVRVHNLGDYAAFNHSAHVNVGIGCESCHGRIDRMEVVHQAEELSMGWCLDCHRAPEEHLRPVSEVTTMGYKNEDQLAFGKRMVAQKNIHPPQYCNGCHY